MQLHAVSCFLTVGSRKCYERDHHHEPMGLPNGIPRHRPYNIAIWRDEGYTSALPL